MATCPVGYTAISLARIDLSEVGSPDKQDVNDFRCSGGGCQAWCAGSDCRVQARCAKAFQFTNGGFEDDLVSDWAVQHPSGWQAAGGVSIVANGNAAWGGLTSGSGRYYAALAGNRSRVQQTLSGLIPGKKYELRFKASRANFFPNLLLALGSGCWRCLSPFLQCPPVYV